MLQLCFKYLCNLLKFHIWIPSICHRLSFTVQSSYWGKFLYFCLHFMCMQYYFFVTFDIHSWTFFSDLGLGDTSAVVLHIKWQQLIPHKACAFLPYLAWCIRASTTFIMTLPVISFNSIFPAVVHLWEFQPSPCPWADKPSTFSGSYVIHCVYEVVEWMNHVFSLIHIPVCIMARIDSTSIESVTSKLLMAFDGAKLASICPTKSHYTCLRSEELKVSPL